MLADAPASLTRAARIGQEIDQARHSGPLQNLVVPPCPQQLAQLRKALAASPPDLALVARIAGGDVAMAATLVRHANSPLYTAGTPVRTVGQAMTRLGLDATAQVMTAFLAANAVRADPRVLGHFWAGSSRRAAAMAGLARHLPGVCADLAHSTGLFLHVGLPVMLQGLRGYAGTLVEGVARKDRSMVQTENANHRTDHAVVGALVARVWRLAPEVVAAIRLHHDAACLGDQGVEPEVRTLVALAVVAEQLAHQHVGTTPEADVRAQAPAALAWLQIGPDELEAWHDDLEALMDAAVA